MVKKNGIMIRIFRNRISEIPENPEILMFRYSDFLFSENREIQKSVKNASDVEFAYVEFRLKSMVIRRAKSPAVLSKP